MNTFAVGLLAFLLLAAKFFFLGTLVLGCIGIYALYRFTVWFIRDLFGPPMCRRPPVVRPARAAPFVPRYQRPASPPPRPQPQVVHAARVEKVSTGRCSWRGKGTPSWSHWGIALVFFALVALSFRAKELVAHEGQPSPPKAGARATAKKVKGRPATPAPAPAPTPVVEAANPAPVTPDASWTVTAVGGSLEAARQKALKEAYDELLVYLHDQNPPIEWKPSSPDYIRKHLKTEWKDEKIKQDDPNLNELEKVDRIYEVSLSVEVLPKQHEEILKLDQRFHAEQRMLWLAKIIGCLIVFLSSIAAYVRLDEWTKGYYSGWLRLAAAGFIGAAGAGLWVLLRS